MDVVEETEDVGLPLEVWFRILSFLPPNALYPTRRVCLNWRDYVDSDATWMGYIEQYYGQRYAKVGFMADPSSSWQERFWRVTRLHQSWVRGECITEVLAGPYGHVRQMRLDGDRLALNHGDKLHVFDKNRNVRVWKYSEEIPFGHTIPHFDLKGSLIAVPSIHDRSVLSIYDLDHNREPNFLHTTHPISVVKLSSSDHLLATGGRKIQVWDQAHPENPILTLSEQHRGVVNCLELSTNLVTASHTGKKIRVWDVRSGARVLTLGGHSHMIHCIAHHGNYICSGSKDTTLRLWDRRKPNEAITLVAHTKPIRALAMDDWKIISGGRDHVVNFWDLSSATRMYKIPEAASAHAIAFDHSTLFVAGAMINKYSFLPRSAAKVETGDCVLS